MTHPSPPNPASRPAKRPAAHTYTHTIHATTHPPARQPGPGMPMYYHTTTRPPSCHVILSTASAQVMRLPITEKHIHAHTHPMHTEHCVAHTSQGAGSPGCDRPTVLPCASSSSMHDAGREEVEAASAGPNFLCLEIGGYVHFTWLWIQGRNGYEGARAIGPTRKRSLRLPPSPRRPPRLSKRPKNPNPYRPAQRAPSSGRSCLLPCTHAHIRHVSSRLVCLASHVGLVQRAHASADATSPSSSAQPFPA